MPKPKRKKHGSTLESSSYLQGLFREFHEHVQKYQGLTSELLQLEARIELAEKTMCLTRDHLAHAITQTQDAAPHDWNTVLKTVRFVGVRLADACGAILRERGGRMKLEELHRTLNDGMFRFRTNSPLREIHAALLRYPFVTKVDDEYVWNAPKERQIAMRLRVVKTVVMPPQDTVKGAADSQAAKSTADATPSK